MSNPQIETRYEIYELSPDGLLKVPMCNIYGKNSKAFCSSETIEDAEQQIIDSDDEYTDYVILTVKQLRKGS
jgi:hypothetical protein